MANEKNPGILKQGVEMNDRYYSFPDRKVKLRGVTQDG